MAGPIIQKIQEAYELIKDFDRWCQGYYQQDKDGKNCPWRDGYKFCGLGAISYAYGIVESTESTTPAVATLQRAAEKLFNGGCLQQINDDASVSPEQAHQNVLKVYQYVLELFKDREPVREDWALDMSNEFKPYPTSAFSSS